MNHVGLPFYQEFGNKGGRRGLSQTCKEAVSVLKQQFREPRFQAILFYIHCLVAIQRNGDYRHEICIDTIPLTTPVVLKIAKINALTRQKHYSLAVLLPFQDDDCELCPAVSLRRCPKSDHWERYSDIAQGIAIAYRKPPASPAFQARRQPPWWQLRCRRG